MRHLLIKITLVFTLIIGSLPYADAQRDFSKFSVGITGSFYKPMNRLELNGFEPAVGIGVNALYTLTNTNIHNQPIALQIGAGITGARTPGRQSTILLAEPEDQEATSAIYNSFVDLNLKGRAVFFPSFFVSPYLEGKIGGRFMGTHQKITLTEVDPFYQEETDNVLVSSNTFMTSVGGGLLIRLKECVDLDLGLTYSTGTSANYADLNSYVLEDNVPSVSYKKSMTEFVGVHIGAKFYLGCGYRSYRTPRPRCPRVKKTPRINKRTPVIKTPRIKKPTLKN